jgi:hypothetical protein
MCIHEHHKIKNSRRQQEPGEFIDIIGTGVLPELVEHDILYPPLRLLLPGTEEVGRRLCVPEMAGRRVAIAVRPHVRVR